MRNMTLMGILIVLLSVVGCKNKVHEPAASTPAIAPAAQLMEKSDASAKNEEPTEQAAMATEQAERSDEPTQDVTASDAPASQSDSKN